ncbi:Ankyrin repeat protein 1 [Giardia muris]|uniref:Ankyrin repeat protein 1 n=1 Tax=Giardia muris TaxID=5742 RepID=A0A4Z1T5B2_GIAMU|nr:Ankyrin repeat protein 1 [Giardia muris]|eukprot:TNJ28287.1 Ankyrin repeat protein 1 [Giardia muris]
MIAATRGSEDIVQILVPHEAGRVNANGHAAVYLAVAGGHERCSRLLYSEASVTDSNGATQLQLMRRLVGLS